MDHKKKQKETDRLMSREEFEDFDMQCTLDRYKKMLGIMAERIDNLEEYVYGVKPRNTRED